MIPQETIDAIVATILTISGSITGIVYGLKKFDLIHFGKQDVKTIKSEVCPLHNEIKAILVTVKDTQIKNVQRHDQHDRDLSEAKQNREELWGEVSDLKEGIGILMDRSGGRPDHWKTRRRK